MSVLTKKRDKVLSAFTSQGSLNLNEALKLVKDNSFENFDASVDVTVNLRTDPKNSDQSVRGSCLLPAGTGKSVIVAVFANAEKADEATEAGADYVGADDLIEKIKSGLKIDKCVATPDMMPSISKIARILGPKGLMPNPKVGTVTNNISEVVTNIKKGQLYFRSDKGAIVHASLGRVSFATNDLFSNFCAFYTSLLSLKPKSLKGGLVDKVHVSTTMGPSVTVDIESLSEIK